MQPRPPDGILAVGKEERMVRVKVEPGQLRRWVAGSDEPIMIVSVDGTKVAWNCKFLKANGEIGVSHSHTLREATWVIA